MLYYEICVETRDEEDNVLNSDYVYKTLNRDEALRKARELRDKYTDPIVIETWDSETDSLYDTTLENQY